MSRSPDGSLTTHFRGSTAPTPGFRRATHEPATPRRTHNASPSPRDLEETRAPRPGRGGGHRGTQGCPPRIAYSPDKGTPYPHLTRQDAANGRVACVTRPSPQPANLRVGSKNDRTLTTAEKIDRSACPGRPGAHDPVRLGTASAYRNYKCRCPDASEACRLYRKRTKYGRYRSPETDVDATGSARRLQALACMGWPIRELGRRLDLRANTVGVIRQGTQQHVFERTHLAIKALYRELSDTPHHVDKRVARHANLSGWAPPAAWDDDTIDDRAAKPQHMAKDRGDESVNAEAVDLHLLLTGRSKNTEGNLETRAARRRWRQLTIRAVHVLAERGVSNPEIAETLRVTERQVLRWKKIDIGGAVRAERHNGDARQSETTPSDKTEEARVA